MPIEKLSREQLRACSVKNGAPPDQDESHLDRDWKLVKQIGRGDNEAAVAELYERLHPGIFSFICYRVGDNELAEDLASETFLRGMTRLASLEFRGVSISAWFYRIAYNLIVDHFRSQAGRRIESLDGEGYSADGAKAVAEWEEARHEEGERSAERLELLHLLDALTPEQKRVLELRFVEGMSNLEVARLIGKTEGAVKSLQHRALTSLARGTVAPADREVREDPLVDTRFDILIHRFANHPVMRDLMGDEGDVERVRQRRHIFVDIMVPVIDTLRPEARMIFQGMLFESRSLGSIQNTLRKRNPRINAEDILEESREILLSNIMLETELTSIELYQLFRGSPLINLLTRRMVREGLRETLTDNELARRRRLMRKPDAPGATFLLSLADEALCRLLGIDVSGEQGSGNHLDRTQPILSSSVSMLVPTGMVISSINGACVVIHDGSIMVNERFGPDGSANLLPRSQNAILRPGREACITLTQYVGGVEQIYPEGTTREPCVVTIFHRDAWQTTQGPSNGNEDAKPLPDHIFAMRRQQLLRDYAHLHDGAGATLHWPSVVSKK